MAGSAEIGDAIKRKQEDKKQNKKEQMHSAKLNAFSPVQPKLDKESKKIKNKIK